MANGRKGNVIYVDTTGALPTDAPVTLVAVQVVGGSATTRIVLYDNTSAAGVIAFDSGAVAINAGQSFFVSGVRFDTGIWAVVTTTGGSAQLYLR